MKKLLTILVAALAFATASFACENCKTSDAVCKDTLSLAQFTTNTVREDRGFRAQSQTFEVTRTSLNLLYLRDGFDNYAAFTLPLYTFANTNGRLKLNTFGAFDPADVERRAYVGTGLSFDVFNDRGWKLTAFGGFKGLNLSDNFRLQDGERAFVWGFGISVPFSTN